MGSRIQTRDKSIITIVPVLGGLITGAIIYFWGCEKFFCEKIQVIEISKDMIGLWGTLLGFIITAISILVTLDTGNGMVEILKKSNHFNTIIYALLSTAIILLLGIIIAVAVVYLSISGKLVYSLLGGVIIAEFISLFFCVFFMFSILVKSN